MGFHITYLKFGLSEMNDILINFKQHNQFVFKPKENFGKVCNAPTNKSGVYIIYELKKGKKELIYIGRSGFKSPDGSTFIRKGGLKDRLVNGKQFKEPRRTSWSKKMNAENIDALYIHWYVIDTNIYFDCPRDVEKNCYNTILTNITNCLSGITNCIKHFASL